MRKVPNVGVKFVFLGPKTPHNCYVFGQIFKDVIKLLLLQECKENDFYYRNAVKRNFIIEIHWK